MSKFKKGDIVKLKSLDGWLKRCSNKIGIIMKTDRHDGTGYKILIDSVSDSWFPIYEDEIEFAYRQLSLF